MSKKAWVGIISVLAVGGILAFFLSTQGDTTEDGRVTIGAILPLTGDAAAWGEQARNGIRLAVDQFNDAHDDLEVSVNYQDTKANPTDAVSAVNSLIRSEDVPAILGGMTSATTLAAAPVSERNGVVLLSPVASSPELTDAGKFIYRIWPPDIFEANFAANWLLKNSYDSLGVVYLNDDFGVPLKNAFRSAFEAEGGTVLFEQGYTKDIGSFRSVVLKVRNASPEAIYLASHYSDAAQIARRFVEQGVEAEIIGTNDLMNEEFIQQAGSAAERAYFPNREAFNPNEDREMVQRFVRQFSERYGQKPGLVEAQAYDAANLILEAIGQGARTGEEVRARLDKRKTTAYEGVTGRIVFDQYGDLKSASFDMMTIQNGNFVPTDSAASQKGRSVSTH